MSVNNSVRDLKMPEHQTAQPCGSCFTMSIARHLGGLMAVFMLLLPMASADEIDFNRDVRPILSRYCFKCHGPDDNARKGGMRLDVRAGALATAESGSPPIVPGRPDDSELIARIETTDDDRMPPPSTKTALSAEQKLILRRWVAGGAEYRAHWAFVAPRQAPLPQVGQTGWPRNAIDRFVLARLEASGLKPSPQADLYALLRRVSLDLVGLPPTVTEVDAFLKEAGVQAAGEAEAANRFDMAYERFVDRLLASPHYGERWARRWLDLARYADTNGYEKDRPRSIWPYRDWVINALNADMPFDQFTIEQLAGDMLPNATTAQRVATGFHRNTMLNEEGGIDPLEFRFHAMTDRVATTGTTWLGLTLGCAQCHTHKYDPISHSAYYEFMAFLDNADEPDLNLPGPNAAAESQRREERAALLVRELPGKYPFRQVEWRIVSSGASVTASSQSPTELLPDGSWKFSGAPAETDLYTFVIDTDLAAVDRLQIEAIRDQNAGPGRTPHGNFVLTDLTIKVAPPDDPEGGQPVTIARAEADFSQDGFPVAHAFDGDAKTGWAIDDSAGKAGGMKSRTATFFFEPGATPPGSLRRWTIQLHQNHGDKHTLARVRLSLGAALHDARPDEVRRAEAIDQGLNGWLEHERTQAVRWRPVAPVSAHAERMLLTTQPDQSVFVSGDSSKTDVYELDFQLGGQDVTAIRLEALPDERLPARGPGMTYYEGTKGDFFLTELAAAAAGQPVRFAKATSSFAQNQFSKNAASAALAIDGDFQTGWSVAGGQGQRHVAVFVCQEPLRAVREFSLRMTYGRHFASSLGRFRISVTSDLNVGDARNLPDDVAKLLLIPDAELTTADRDRLRREFLMQAPELAQFTKEIRELQQPPAMQTTLVLQERPAENPRLTSIHHRGEFLQPTERVSPHVPSFLPGVPGGAPANRLTFARWLVSPGNPLTARVTINRQWAGFFGRGLVRTTGDFGYQGELPSHPELLDWLAVEFVNQGWSLKKMHKLIVMSATYRQASQAAPDLYARDPDNSLLARGPRVRLDAEIIRDSLLQASGLLSRKIGGPSVYPPQPASVTTEGAYGAISWTPSQGEDRFRRSLYTFSKRTAPFAMYATFDAPSGEACVARRDASNTPLQALTLLNDQVCVEASQALGRILADAPGPVEQQIIELYRRAVVRPPDEHELSLLAAFYARQLARLNEKSLDAGVIAGEAGEQAPLRAAWTLLARAVFNLDEMVVKE